MVFFIAVVRVRDRVNIQLRDIFARGRFVIAYFHFHLY